jgi:hypothetical protein
MNNPDDSETLATQIVEPLFNNERFARILFKSKTKALLQVNDLC